MNITSTHQRTVNYKTPVLKRESIGAKPKHFFDKTGDVETSYVSLDKPHDGGDQVVFASQPVRTDDGQVKFDQAEQQIDLTPRSALLHGLGWGAGGAFVGSMTGLLASTVLGTPPGISALVCAAAVGGIAGSVTGYSVAQEKTALVWDQHNVYQHSMEGYHQMAGVGEKDGEQGFFHRFVPQVRSEVTDTYKTPRVVRYKGDEVPTEETSAAWPMAHTKREPEVPNRNVDVTVSFDKEHLVSRYVGSMPYGYHSSSSGVSDPVDCGPDGCKVESGQSVYRNLPVYEPNGAARVDPVNERVVEGAATFDGMDTVVSLIGGMMGGGLGAVGTLALGIQSPIPAVATAVLGAGLTAYSCIRSNANDRVRLEWREESIDEGKMVGYYETSRQAYKEECTSKYNHSEEKWERECEQVPDGYDHYFHANVDYNSVGTYVKPVVVHYSAKEAGEA